MFTGSLSLALFTIVFRRIFDSVTGRIPVLPTSSSHNTTAILAVSGALYYVYSHLKKGTLVKIGQRPPVKNPSCSFSTVSQRRVKNNKSWFLKNIWGNRKNCTNAICRIAKQSFESVTNLNPCLLLPKKTFRISFPNTKKPTRDVTPKEIITRSCDIIYNNEVFQKDSDREIRQTRESKKINMASKDSLPERTRRREKISIVKRLSKDRKSLGDMSRKYSNKLNFEKAGKTRSGKVYSPLKFISEKNI